MKVQSLGYIGLESSYTEEWRNFCTEFLGLMDVSENESEQRYRMDENAWRIAIQPGRREDLVYVGFEVSSAAELASLCTRLKELGYEVREEEELCVQRGVSEIRRVIDPDGVEVELYIGATRSPERPFVSPVGVKGFVTGSQGLGHIVLFTKNIAAKKEFYITGLGFSLSDTITIGEAHLDFLHCNSRHHTLALAEAPLDRQLSHFMLQVDNLDDVGLSNDRAIAMSIPITAQIGCHTNDRMVSFYAKVPSGYDVEYGYGASNIDGNWTVSHYNEVSIWGHHGASPGIKT